MFLFRLFTLFSVHFIITQSRHYYENGKEQKLFHGKENEKDDVIESVFLDARSKHKTNDKVISSLQRRRSLEEFDCQKVEYMCSVDILPCEKNNICQNCCSADYTCNPDGYCGLTDMPSQ
eukprot:TCONS_00058423-protein